jgi:thioredoxin reductase (NADPH)
LFISDQRMPEMEGVDFLQKAREFFPNARRVLLTAYSDTDAAIKAINSVQLDYYLMKPWDPPEEKLYPVISELLDDWQDSYRPAFKGIKVIGYQFSPQSHEIKEFLAGNLVPYQWQDIEISQEAARIAQAQQYTPQRSAGSLPGKWQLPFRADDTGYCGHDRAEPGGKKYHLRCSDHRRGSGRPGSLRLWRFGRVEDLAGRTPVSGRAGRHQFEDRELPGISQWPQRYRADPPGGHPGDTAGGRSIVAPVGQPDICQKDGYKKVTLDNGDEINTHAVVITTGVDYRKLETKGIPDFTGAGIYYGAAMTEASAFRDCEVFVVGGGNSAGQAAMHLSKFARNVNIVIRKDSLGSTMSAYLIDQIATRKNIHLLCRSEIVEATGGSAGFGWNACRSRIWIRWRSAQKPANALFIFIGARPFTDWIGLDIIKDDKGFLETGRDLTIHADFKKIWKHDRDPYLLETSCPGIFAAGDVRAGAMNRVASAVGEGSMSISFVHKYLAEV